MLDDYKRAVIRESQVSADTNFWSSHRPILDKMLTIEAVGPFQVGNMVAAKRAGSSPSFCLVGEPLTIDGLNTDDQCLILTPQGAVFGKGAISNTIFGKAIRTPTPPPANFYLYLCSTHVSSKSFDNIPDWPPANPFAKQALQEQLSDIPETYLNEPHPLDEASIRALQGAVADNPIFGIKGPPGTGKTSMLARVATYLAAEKGLKVLIAAKAHKAVDNALLETAKYAKRRKFLIHRKTSRRADFETSGMPEAGVLLWRKDSELGKGGHIVGATIDSKLDGLAFDVIIVDEAGQVPMFVASTLSGYGKRFIFFGDDAQLPPILIAHHIGAAAYSAIQFILRKDSTNSYLVPLRVTHRLNREICSIVGEQFYEGIGLKPSVANKDSRIIRVGDHHCGDEAMAKLVSISCKQSNTECPEEVDVAESLIEGLLEAHILVDGNERPLIADDIAVLTPYRAQARRLRSRLEALGVRKVGTVDIMQGQSVAVVIMCLTTTKVAHLSTRSEWLFQPNRINVGISRAKAACYFLANPQSINETNPSTIAGMENLEMMKCLIRRFSVGSR